MFKFSFNKEDGDFSNPHYRRKFLLHAFLHIQKPRDLSVFFDEVKKGGENHSGLSVALRALNG